MSTTDERLTVVERRQTSYSFDLYKQIGTVRDDIMSFRTENRMAHDLIVDQIAALGGRLDGFETRLEKVEARLDKVETRLSAIEGLLMQILSRLQS